ncbi:hypothetical protein BS17DRAFT_789925 [Gyrodon lividus]|nr:hypothetical protein BS17DRAFT_789925 [Gyrodon lividus]
MFKPGFLNTAKAKKAVEEAHASKPDPSSLGLLAPSKGKGKARAVDQDEDTGDVGDVNDNTQPMHQLDPEAEQPKGDSASFRYTYHPQSASDYHCLPPAAQLLYGTKKRAVFREWPRDPKGKHILPDPDLKGKSTPNELPWGATLYDFFIVRRIPEIPNAITKMTGSKLLKVMEKLGELGSAKHEVEWAVMEEDPKIIPVADTKELIEAYEKRAHMGMYDSCSMIGVGIRKSKRLREKVKVEDEKMEKGDGGGENDDCADDANAACTNEKEAEGNNGVPKGPPCHAKGGGTDDVRDAMDVDDHPNSVYGASMHRPESEPEEEEDKFPIIIPHPLKVPVTSPFHPSHYPPPWPLIPFKNPQPPVLQERIPLHLLPHTLRVHDPFNVLSVCGKKADDTPWLSKRDTIQNYVISLSPATQKEVEKAREKAEELEEMKARTLVILRYTRSEQQIENYEPIIEVPLPPYQRRLTNVEEGHLYISPVAKLGEGNHSVVYKAEWELPRDLLTEPNICPLCMKKSMQEEMQRLRDSGRWDRMMRAVSWGPKGLSGRSPTEAEVDAMEDVNDPPILEKNGEIIEREIICIVPPGAPPMEILRAIEKGGVWDMLRERINGQGPTNQLVVQFAEEKALLPKGSKSLSTAPVIRINPKLTYQHSCHTETVCAHKTFLPVPRTTKFTVAAKLSIQYDRHLMWEAENYQNFPEHLFQHWNGYNIVPPIHDPVPVHAVVPQFYGYYIPARRSPWSYFSPILLLEHCGTPIDPDTLCADDQEECASLLLRFHAAGWLHESFAARNILAQQGSPTEFPIARMVSEQLSFRLIDFGRSTKCTQITERMQEEVVAWRLFKLQHGAF